MLTLFSKQINKAIDECKSSAVMAKKFVGNIETKKWTLKKKNKVRAYQVTTDDDDEYVSWGSDFDESCSDDGTDGLGNRTNGNCDNVNDDYDLNCDDDDDDGGLAGRCGSYTLTDQTDCHSSHQLHGLGGGNTVVRSENINKHGSAIYDNTYEAISETPSTSSYGGSSENSSTCFYETPPERRRGSCPSDTDKSSSGIDGMNGSTRSNSGDDRSDLSSLHFDGYSLDEKKRNSHDHDSDLNHFRDSHNHHHHGHHNNNNLHHQLSVEVTKEYIMRELNRKKRTLLNGCEASSETSSGQCSEPSPKPRIRPLVKPAIPPKPNIAHFNNQSKPGSPGTRRKIRRKIVRPTGEPPPPPVPKSPPPISPASSKLSLTDRLAELTLDDLNEVLGVQLSSEPEDNDVGDEGDGAVSKLSTTINSNKNDNLTTNCINEKDKQQLESISDHNLTVSKNQNQKQASDEMGSVNSKKTKSFKQIETKNDKSDKADNNNHDNQSSSLGINEINDIVNGIMDHDDDDEDFGDYETPLNFKEPIAQQINHLNNLRGIPPIPSSVNKIPSTGNSGHHQCPTGSPIVSPSNGSISGCNRFHSRSSSVASGSFPPDLGFSDCTGISPYPISPPPPFDDNFCCSCRKLMKSVGSTPNLNAIRSSSSSSRSDLSLSQVTSSTPLSSSLSSTTSMRNQSNQPTTAQTFDNNSHNSSSSNHHQHHQAHQQQNQHSHSHSTSNLSLLTVDRPKLPRSKPDCGHSNTNNGNSNNKSCNSNNNLTTNNNNNNNTSTGTSLKAEIAAKFAEKAAYARKIINSRPPFRPFESIYATGKSFGFSSSSCNNHHPTKSSSSMSASSLNINANNNHNINRSGSTSSLAQRPLPPLPDDVMPIEKYSWFHSLERDSAATVLEHLGTDGSYLVRPSKRAGQSNPLTLSILHHGKVFHLNIRRRSDGLFCLGKEKDKERTFASVPALIRFHQKEPILLTTKGESAGITKLMVTPIASSSTINPSS